MNELIKLKEKRDIGENISTYFEFFKQNLKSYVNIFIRYNGLFLIGYLAISYLLVTGFMGAARTTAYGSQNTGMSEMYIGLGMIGFLLLFFVTTILNYGIAASYAIQYEKNPTKDVDKKLVWGFLVSKLGSVLLFTLLSVVMMVIIFTIGLIFTFIPIIGTFINYGIQLFFISWMGLSFMAMLYENKDVTDALGEGWRLLFQYFWKSILVNLVVGILITVFMFVLYLIPGILIGIYVFHSVDSQVALIESPVATVIFTLGAAILLIGACFNQSLSMLVNSVLYFSHHEETYHEEARKRIDEIGKDA